MKPTALAIVLLLAVAARAAESSPGIIFLHLRMTNGQVELVNQTRTPGTLKHRGGKEPARGLEVELHSKAGATLWTQTVDDPASQRLEYEDPANPGKILAREATFTNVEFTVRVPANSGAESAAFFRRDAAGTKAAGAPSRREIGRITLQPTPAK